MSTIQTNAIVDAAGGNTATINGITPNAATVVGRNLIINGDMQVAQRGTTATGTGAGSSYSTVDRWRNQKAGSPLARFTETQSADYDAPTGHSKSLKLQVTTANGTIPANSFQYIDQFVESQNLSHLKWDTASSGEPLILSFWVKCSTAQVFAIDFIAYSAASKYLTKNYTVNSANTWEKKTITIPADASNAIPIDNSRGLRLRWALTSGSDSNGSGGVDTTWQTSAALEFSGHVNTWADSVGGTWQLAGVQLEVGTVATSFEHKTYAAELTACQRYCQLLTAAAGSASSTSAVEFGTGFYPEMRGAPTASATAALIVERHNVTAYTQSSAAVTIVHSTGRGAKFTISNFSGLTAGNGYTYSGYQSGSGHIVLDSEL